MATRYVRLTIQCTVILTVLSACILSGVNATAATANGASSSDQGNPFFMTLFDAVLSTMDGKLRRIENLDRAVEHMMRRVESLYGHIKDNLEKTDAVMAKLRAIDTKLFNVGGTKGIETLDSKLIDLDKKVNILDTKLASVNQKLSSIETNTVNTDSADKLQTSASERRVLRVDFPKHHSEMQAKVIGDIQSVKEQLGNMERSLQRHILQSADGQGILLNTVSEIHEAVTTEDSSEPTVTNSAAFLFNRTQGRSASVESRLPKTRISRLEALQSRIDPISSVSQKMDEVWSVVVGTKSTVDDLVPQTVTILDKSNRQERAISDIHTDLNEKANRILENLGTVEKILDHKMVDPPIEPRNSRRVFKTRQQKRVEQQLQQPTTPVTTVTYQDERQVEYRPEIRRVIQKVNDASRLPPQRQEEEGSSSQKHQIFVKQQQFSELPAHIQEELLSEVNNSRSVVFPSIEKKPTQPVAEGEEFLFTNDPLPSNRVKGYSCYDLYQKGITKSGVYFLQIRGTSYWYLKVYCNMESEGGGWTVIQRRNDFGTPRENFNRDWEDYKHGFGSPSKEFWLGNENIFMLTNTEDHEIRIELEDFEGERRQATYSNFRLYSEAESYKLEISGYSGDAGDSLNDPWYGSNLSPFSTFNRDNDRSSLNCASMLKGGWWWRSCGRGLNGLYLTDPSDSTARQGIVWFRWKGWDNTLKKASMMIRPKPKQTTETPAR